MLIICSLHGAGYFLKEKNMGHIHTTKHCDALA